MTGDIAIRRLWPDAAGVPVDAEQLTSLYGRADRPLVRMNFVTSVDGAVEVDGYSAGLSGPPDKRVFGVLRMVCDALLVGAGTLRHEGYRAVRLDADRRAWRREHGLAETPTLVVVSASLDLDPAAPVFADAPVRPLVLTHRRATAPAGLDLVADLLRYGADRGDTDQVDADDIDADDIDDIDDRRPGDQDERGGHGRPGGRVDLAAGLAELRRRGLAQVLSEGGPHLFGALTAADLVDEVCLTVAPMLAGPGAGRITAGTPAPPRGLSLRHVLAADDGNLLLRYARAAPTPDALPHH
jgi:riboflavin biosynthesis pyrimidine reductase